MRAFCAFVLMLAPCRSAHTPRGATSLLQRSRENQRLEGSSHSVPGAQILRGDLTNFHLNGVTGAGAAERSHGHFLTNHELQPIVSISCLELKQKNPGVSCQNASIQGASATSNGSLAWSGELNAGNFPNYKDEACRSGGEFLCDPYVVLTDSERLNVTAALGTSRGNTPVSCRQLNYKDKVDGDSFAPFYLGVAILKDWPVQQSDSESLQRLGQIVTGEWDMERLYVGRTRPYLRCPNSGMLFIFPDRDHAFLSTDSCQFICESKGGPSVVAATLLALRSKGAGAAAMAGIEAAYAFMGTKAAAAAAVSTGDAEDYNPVNTLQRVLFGVALGLLILSLIVGTLVLCMAPGAIKELKQRRR